MIVTEARKLKHDAEEEKDNGLTSGPQSKRWRPRKAREEDNQERGGKGAGAGREK